MVLGIVRFWRINDGWGVIDSPETPGGCWARFDFIEMEGYRRLAAGQVVDLAWMRPVTGEHEGFYYVATGVRPVEQTTAL